MVRNLVLPVPACACQAIFIATSTDTEPESARKTWGSPLSSTRLRPSSTAGAWVRPPNITWLIRPSWSWTAASSSGTAYPWMGLHHEDMPSITSTRSPARRSRRRTPLADSTSWTGEGAEAEEYGCQRWSRSQSRRSATGDRPVLDAGRAPAARDHLDHHPSAAVSAVARGLEAQSGRADLVVALGEGASAVPAVARLGHDLRSAHSGP